MFEETLVAPHRQKSVEDAANGACGERYAADRRF
jgi:hypothetical protein